MATQRPEFEPATIAFWRRCLWSLALLLLAAPWLAMHFSEAVRWSASDFVVFGLLLGSAGLLMEGLVRVRRERRFVLTALLLVGGGFLLVWVELAVGIIGGS